MLRSAVKAFNEKFSTFEIHISKDGEEKTYVSTAKSLADFVKDLKEALADAGVEAETEAESESEVETEAETETEAVSEAETDAEDAEEETAVTNNGTEINLNDYKAMFAIADMLSR